MAFAPLAVERILSRSFWLMKTSGGMHGGNGNTDADEGGD